MHVVITARHLSLAQSVKEYAESKALKLVKFYDLVQEVEVTLEEAERGTFHAEFIVSAEHRNMFVANAREESIEACIDACYDKLERQLTEHKNRHRNRKHPEAGAEASTIRHSPA